MAAICSCTDGIINFGQPNCVPSFGRDSRLIFVNYSDDSGAVNSIKSTDTLDQTYFDGKFNATDLSQRWYLTDTINNVVGVREDNITQDIDTIPFNVRQGNRMYDGTFYGTIASPTFERALESMSCQTMGFFIVDVAGSIIGMDNQTTGDLDPIKIQRNTFQFKYTFPSATEVQNINVKFMIEENEQDSDLSFVGSDNISVDLLTQKAMSTVVLGTAANITATTFETAITFTYGQQFQKEAYEGALVGDFSLFNETTSSAVVVNAAPELPAGTYTITYAAQTAADVLKLSYQKTSGTGFESVTDLEIIAV